MQPSRVFSKTKAQSSMPKKSLVSWNKNLNTCQTHLNNVSTNRLFLRVCLCNARGGAGLWVQNANHGRDKSQDRHRTPGGWDRGQFIQVNGIQKVKGGGGGRVVSVQRSIMQSPSYQAGLRLQDNWIWREERERVSCQEIGAISGEWPGMWVKR